MKNRYQRLDRKGRKEAKKRYIDFSERNKKYMALLTRMLVLGILGLIYGIVSALFDVFILPAPIYSYIIDAVIVIFSVFLIVEKGQIQASTMNKFLIDESKGTKIKEEVKEEPKKEIEVKVEEKKEVVEPKKKTTKKTTTTKKTETKKEETIELPKTKKRKHVSKNSKAKKAAKKKSK